MSGLKNNAKSKRPADNAADKHDLLAEKRDVRADTNDLKRNGIALPRANANDAIPIRVAFVLLV